MIESFDMLIAVMSKGLGSNSWIKNLFNGIRFMIKFKYNKKRAAVRSQFFMTCLKQKTVFRMMRLSELNIIKSQLKKGFEKVELDKKIYIPINEADLITEDNLDDASYPDMFENNLEMQCEFTKKNYDPTTSVKVRIIYDWDWFAVDWKKNRLRDDDMEPVTVKAIVLHIHGGGFIGGSSSDARGYTIEYATKLGVPFFSVDYRLSPTYKFPDALNDWWHVYLWLLEYWEIYLQLKPLKIILMGDSAGGNLCLGVLNLAILKGVTKPDGIHILYPSLMISSVHFVPSFLLSADDAMLNSTFLKLALESYASEKMSLNNHYLLSPSITPRWIRKKYPKVRMLVAGLDPLRDDQIQ
jgi:acetyl esterase/lipase